MPKEKEIGLQWYAGIKQECHHGGEDHHDDVIG